jgi:hypothetical protein
MDIIKLENPVTIVTDKAITIADSNFTVTAKAEHIPNTKTVIGLVLKNGLVNIFYLLPWLLNV